MQAARILIVDDDVDHATFMADVLADHGYRPELAFTVDEALERLDGEAFELVITDLRMPGKDGLQLIEELRAERPEIAIIAMTAFGSFETAIVATRAGAFEYLSKPFEAGRLLGRIHDALDRRARVLKSQRLRSEIADLLRKNRSK